MDNVITKTILLAKINAVMDMQIYVLEQRKKLEAELEQVKKDETKLAEGLVTR